MVQDDAHYSFAHKNYVCVSMDTLAQTGKMPGKTNAQLPLFTSILFLTKHALILKLKSIKTIIKYSSDI